MSDDEIEEIRSLTFVIVTTTIFGTLSKGGEIESIAKYCVL